MSAPAPEHAALALSVLRELPLEQQGAEVVVQGSDAFVSALEAGGYGPRGREDATAREGASLLVYEGVGGARGPEAGELAEALGELREGDWAVILTAVPQGRRGRRRSGGRSPVDSATTTLFARGFTDLRFRRRGGEVAIAARRATLASPSERELVLSVVMPVYNEATTFSEVIETLLAKHLAGIELEIIIVESGSTDGTRELVEKVAADRRVHVVYEPRPMGKGHAVRAGIEVATGDFVLIQDADLEYDLDDYERLVRPLARLEASFVLGIRTRTDGAKWGVRHFERQVLLSKALNVGNVLFLTLFNTVYGEKLKDPFTMYKVFRRDCVSGLVLECNRFDFDWELTGKLLRRGFVPLEVPVSYSSRGFSEGKKVSVLHDPWTWVVACFRYRFAALDADPERADQAE